MDWTKIPAGTLNAAQQRLWVALGEHASSVATRINNEPVFVKQLARFAKDNEPSTTQKRARAIMGTNMFGIEDATKYFGVNPSKPQLAALSVVPFNEETLLSYRDTHILVAVFPLSIIQIREKVKNDAQCLFHKASRYDAPFAGDRGEAWWYLIKKTPVDHSMNKSWNRQRELLGDEEETPHARVMVYSIIAHFKSTGERLFHNIGVRCADPIWTGYHVYIEKFDVEGLFVGYHVDDNPNRSLGLASSRK